MVNDTNDKNSKELDANDELLYHDEPKERVTWSSTVEFIVSLIGYSAGLSDFWRFPYLVWRNGGGAFLIAYLMTLIFCGIPIYFLEITFGQYSGKGVFEIWNFCPLFKGIGISIALLNLWYVSYVTTMRYWLLEYMRQSFTTELPWSSCGHTWNTNSCRLSHALLSYSADENKEWNSTANFTGYLDRTTDISAEEEFWQYNILSLSSGISDIGYPRWWLVLWAVLLKILTVIGLLKSVRSVGKLMFVTTFLPPFIGLAMLIQALTQNGATRGLLFLITPDFTRLAESQVWIEAAFMAFYSLGPGWGSLMMMGSHVKFRTNCLRNVLISTIGDVFSAVFSSVVLFAVLGVMASEIGVSIENIVRSGMSIGLVGYSRALVYLPAPYIWAVLFFMAVTIVGIDVQVICTETVVSFLEGFNIRLGRHCHLILVVLINIVMFIFSLPFCTQAGPYMFQLVDWYLPTWSVVVIALLEVIAFMWFYGGDLVDAGLKDMTGRKMSHLFRVAAAYVSPVVLVLLLLISFMKYQPPKYGSYVYPDYTNVIGWVIAFSLVIPIPLHIFWKLTKLSGTIQERWIFLTQPTDAWGPVDSSHRLDYLEWSSTKRSWKDVAYYNLTGRPRSPVESQFETVAL